MNDTPTPRTKNETGKPNGNHAIVYASFARKLERELTTVTEQRDGFKKELEIANLRLKGKRHPDDNGIMADGEIDVKAVTEQRDRLAETLNNNWELLIALQHYFDADYPIDVTRIHYAAKLTREALQSLKQDHTVATNDMIAAVKGGADEIRSKNNTRRLRL